MKKIKIYSLIVAFIMVVISCDKTENPVGQRGTYPVPGLDITSAFFAAQDLVNSYVEFTVTIPPGYEAQSGSVLVSYNDQGERAQIATISSFPSTFHLKLTDVLTALGMNLVDVSLGDVFVFEILTTKNGVTTHSAAVLSAPIACGYIPALAEGSYHSVSADWAEDAVVTFAVDPSDSTIIYVTGLAVADGCVEDGGPLVMHLNPLNFSVVADKTVLASFVPWGPYHNEAYEGSGTYNSCDGTFTMIFSITVTEGSFGSYHFTFTRE